MNNLASLLEELQVSDAEGLCSTFFLGNICVKVLAGSHCEKEGASAELSYCDFFYGGASLNELAKNNKRERFLLFRVFVEVAVAAIFLRKKDQQFYIVIKAGISPLTNTEGLIHVVNGGLDCYFSQGSES